MRIGSLFSGYGGLELGVQAALGGTVAWHAEVDPAPARILAHHWPAVPNLGDVTAVDWSAVEPVDVLAGGFPCQDVSAAGRRAGMTAGNRSGLWSYMAAAVATLRPPLVVIENVRGLLHAPAQHPAHRDLEPCPWCMGDDSDSPLRALGAVLGDLAELGYDARWQGLRAADVGAPHGRFRVFITARPAAPDAPGSHGRGGRVGQQAGDPAGGRRADTGRCSAPPDPEGHGRHEGRPEPARLLGGPHAPLCGDAPADPDPDRDALRQQPVTLSGSSGPALAGLSGIEWGPYAAAIERWERRLGRPAPTPTEPGPRAGDRLSPRFVEWLMGLEAGHVTAVPGLTRNDQLRALGNGVVPQQAAEALRRLL